MHNKARLLDNYGSTSGTVPTISSVQAASHIRPTSVCHRILNHDTILYPYNRPHFLAPLGRVSSCLIPIWSAEKQVGQRGWRNESQIIRGDLHIFIIAWQMAVKNPPLVFQANLQGRATCIFFQIIPCKDWFCPFSQATFQRRPAK